LGRAPNWTPAALIIATAWLEASRVKNAIRISEGAATISDLTPSSI
jgi:hypothetical protein